MYVEIILLIVAFIWGINLPIMKIGLAYLAPAPYNSIRVLIAIPIVWLVLALSKTYRPVDRSDIKTIALISVLGFFVFQLFFTAGVQSTTAGNASVFLGMLPLTVAGINRLFNIEVIVPRVMVAIVASLGGIVLMVVGSGKELSFAGNHVLGALLLLFAQFGYGYYTVFSKDLMRKYSPYQVTAYVITLSGILFLLVSLPEMLTLEWSGIPLSGWLSTLYSGIFALCIGNYLWVWGVGKIGSARSSLYNNLSPAFAIITSYFLLGETFGLPQCAGAAVIFWGVYLTRTRPGAPATETEK
ncbi:MAG: DMT family transporter [Negativicutes bacterium]|nr:DMT family transporter [Negativicutes bacterium]